MNFDETGQVIYTSINNDVITETPTEGDSVDSQAAIWTEFVMQAGNVVNETATMRLGDSDDDVTFTAVSGVDPVVLTADDEMGSFLVKRGAARRYLSVLFVKGGAGSTRVHCYARQWGDVKTGSNFPTESVLA